MAERVPWVRYPTPVLDGKRIGSNFLWIKNDGLSGTPYGGNKARKLAGILRDAETSGTDRLVTAGAAGSHHVLATTVYGTMRGYRVAAWLWPQTWSRHAEATLGAALSQGLEPLPVRSAAMAVARLGLSTSRSDFPIAVGGFGLAAAIEYAKAAKELADDVARGDLPKPDEIVVAVGTGSTAAGLLAGLVHYGVSGLLVGVTITTNPFARPIILSLAARTLRAIGSGARISELHRRLELDHSRVGRGYGYPTEEGARATEVALALGLELDPTYTAKAFARALASTGAGGFSPDPSGRRLPRPPTTLYWHTLSAHPLAALVKPGAGSKEAGGLSVTLFRDRPSART
jgi:1-aminocyclopropane-1-carboxylate deaminase/D-cysteine desulfhydrase-like pyridoxal-dependent ACC family enzyme